MAKIKSSKKSSKDEITHSALHVSTKVVGKKNSSKSLQVTVKHNGKSISLKGASGVQALHNMVDNAVMSQNDGWETGPCDSDSASCVQYTSPVTKKTWHCNNPPPPSDENA